MAKPTTIDHNLKTASVKVRADVLEIDLDPEKLVEKPAEAMAKAVAHGIRSHGPVKWNKTGRLASGIAVVDAQVVAPADRLQRDPELVEKLIEDVREVREPLTAPGVQEAIGEALADAIKVKR